MGTTTATSLDMVVLDRSLNELWAEAFQLWLDNLASPNTRRAYREIWQYLLSDIGKMPWEIQRADLVRWMQLLREHGLSDCTRNLRIAAISSFYSFVNDDYTMIVNGQELPLYPYNPASSKSLRVKVDPYGKARALSIEEVRALLAAPDRSTIQGLRDFALLMTYLFTGRRNSEVRHMRWGDIEQRAGVVWYRWTGKRKRDQRYELPSPAWEAILAYLRAANRFNAIRNTDYLFIGLDGDAREPLCMREIGRILKKYAVLAGIDSEEIHVHLLRHTAAALRRQAGDDIEQVSYFLGHSSLSVTQIYLHRTEGQRDQSWDKVKNILGL